MEPADAGPAPGRVAPLAPGRYALQVTLSQDAYEKLRHAQALRCSARPPRRLVAHDERPVP